MRFVLEEWHIKLFNRVLDRIIDESQKSNKFNKDFEDFEKLIEYINNKDLYIKGNNMETRTCEIGNCEDCLFYKKEKPPKLYSYVNSVHITEGDCIRYPKPINKRDYDSCGEFKPRIRED